MKGKQLFPPFFKRPLSLPTFLPFLPAYFCLVTLPTFFCCSQFFQCFLGFKHLYKNSHFSIFLQKYWFFTTNLWRYHLHRRKYDTNKTWVVQVSTSKHHQPRHQLEIWIGTLIGALRTYGQTPTTNIMNHFTSWCFGLCLDVDQKLVG